MMIWAWLVCKFCSGFRLVPSFNGFLLSSFDLLCGFLLLLILRVLCGALEGTFGLIVQLLLGLISLLFCLYMSRLDSLMCYLIGRSLAAHGFYLDGSYIL